MTQANSKAPDDVLDYVHHLSPEFARPDHLSDLNDLFHEILANVRGKRELPVRALVTYPQRHWKTETVLHGAVWLLEQEPTLRIILLAYSFDRVKHTGKRIRELAERTGEEGYKGRDVSPARGYNEIHNWSNKHKGGVLIMSADQSREGHDCNVLLCDDPIDEIGAREAAKRDAVDKSIAYYTSRCYRFGGENNPAALGPVVIVASRQGQDDPTGRRRGRGWEYERFFRPAIFDLDTPDERPFAPKVWSLEHLKAIRAEAAQVDPLELVWWSRYQGEPRSVQFNPFGIPARYESIPTWAGFFTAWGIDMSYTATKRSDYFALVVARCWLQGAKPQIYIVNTVRTRADIGAIGEQLRQAKALYGDCPIYTYTSGPERAAVDVLRRAGFRVLPMHASAPKFVRAQSTIERWNSGQIMLPVHSPWGDGFMRNVGRWAGNEADPDDEVDALVSLVDGVTGRGGSRETPRKVGAWTF